MKNLKRFGELNEEDSHKNIDKTKFANIDINDLLEKLVKERNDEEATKAELLIVYINLVLSAEERAEIKENI